METKLHTFIDIFDADFNVDGEIVHLESIMVPKIQRDYAQGRKDAEVSRIRTRFLSALYNAVQGTPITLDFVYGDVSGYGVMSPLDGQQRLTALFLLHWFAAKKEKIDISEYAFLKNFSYDTRFSARDFCEALVEFTPSFSMRLSDEIIDQAWFPLDWKRDPTINSMLVVLDAIAEIFMKTESIWKKLKGGAITFYFLPIKDKDMGLTDELYIKMNSRGKPLTQFEHFKAELEHELRKVDDLIAKRIMKKIDLDWTDMLWHYRGDDNVTDDEFLRYFRFVCDVICYHQCGTPQGKSNDEFDLIKEYFSSQSEGVIENILLLEQYFDCWCTLRDIDHPGHFMSRYFSKEHQSGKIIVESKNEIDIFGDCLRNYADIYGNGNRIFPLNRIILLYAVISYLVNKENITESEFSRRLRIVNNLIQNSEDDISDSEQRSSGNRMPQILEQVDAIIQTGKIDESIKLSFSMVQLTEEKEKILWLEEHPDKAEELFEFEDHHLLYGQIGIVGLDKSEYYHRFQSLFSCDLDLVDCALMSLGNYGQREMNGWRYQFGSKNRKHANAWRKLFHKSANDGFERTKEVLMELLDQAESFSDEILNAIIETYVYECDSKREFEWRYYYVKIPMFRPGSYGKYYWNDFENKPYEFSVMQTQYYISTSTYQPFLKAIDARNLSLEHFGERIIRGDKYIICENSAYVVKSNESGEEIERIPISQNAQGVDTEDRIEKMRSYQEQNI